MGFRLGFWVAFVLGIATVCHILLLGASPGQTQNESLPKIKLLVIKTEGGNVGVGDKATPAAKLDVFGGDIYVSSAGNGVILKSPDGTKCKRVYIDNAGVLQTADVTPCP